jgi:uncharacterized sulfatase
MKHPGLALSVLSITLMLLAKAVSAATQVEPDLALEMLNKQERQFEQQVVQTADNVFTAVGFHGANTSMIVGHDGVIIVDTLMGPASAANAFKALREYSDKPVKAIIYTHSHPDHTGGASVFAGNDNPEIYAMAHFGSAHGVDVAINPIMVPRGIRQFGRKLTGREVTNRGLAPAGTIDHDRGKGHLPPTFKIDGDSYRINVAGIDIEMHAGPGETDDALFVWLPREKVLFAGDNFYHTFPNLYAIRGTAYRDVLKWSNSVAKMASLQPEYLVPGHTLPIKSKEASVGALQDYSDAIRSVYDQTVKGINQGKGPDLIAHKVELPAHLRNKPYLVEFYGTVSHAVRAIYAGLLGWFDGNPTTLNRLAPKVEAQKMAELAGGTSYLTEKMQTALTQKEFQWALELADHLKWLDDADKQLARKTRIKALRGLASREYNAPNRNYYLSYANELESGQLSQVWF